MLQATATKFAASAFDRARLARIADGLAVALAASIPWSTSATAILSALWLLTLLPSLDRAQLRRIVLSAAGGLPILFALLAVAGMLWSQAPLNERFAAVVPYARLLAVPLLLCQFSRSPRGEWVIYGLIVSCTVLLIASFWSYAGSVSGLYPFPVKQYGVPVKDYIGQSGLFTICAFALLEIGAGLWARRRRLAVLLLLLALAFLANIAIVVTARTALLVIAVLLVLYALRRSSLKTGAAILAASIVLIGIAWVSSSYLRTRVTDVFREIREYTTQNKDTSSGQRLALWHNAVQVIVQAPVIGHGTGSLTTAFKSTTFGDNSIIRNADNPHNQTFVVAIQLGLIGVAVLYALWLAHLLLFRGPGWTAWFGLVVVVHSIVGSLVNSYLFDFTAAWTYVVCVGVTGGMMLQRTAGDKVAAPPASKAP